MEKQTLEFLYLRIITMQNKIDELNKIIKELNSQFIIDRNIDVKQLKK